MYRNLESHQGRLANELGQTRKTLDELLVQKRGEDLRANGGKYNPNEIDPAELLTKPSEVLDRYVKSKAEELVKPFADKVAALESKQSAYEFATKHADSSAITQSPEFRDWVRATPLRSTLAQNAARGDGTAADMLLTEYKLAKPKAGGESKSHLDEVLSAAGKVSLEGSRNGATEATPGGKVYKRADLIALRQRNPDRYNELSSEIELAYREGRVR
jgi:hypothetical protein